jgi:recombination protein RecA
MKSKPDLASALDARLNTTLSSIRRLFGEGSILRLGANDFPPVETLSTGFLAADIALGIGGLPKGRIVEMFGPESSGKTTVCLSIIAETQRQNGTAAIIDVEHALDLKWARLCGVDTGSLLISQPDSGEDALTIAEQLILSVRRSRHYR